MDGQFLVRRSRAARERAQRDVAVSAESISTLVALVTTLADRMDAMPSQDWLVTARGGSACTCCAEQRRPAPEIWKRADGRTGKRRHVEQAGQARDRLLVGRSASATALPADGLCAYVRPMTSPDGRSATPSVRAATEASRRLVMESRRAITGSRALVGESRVLLTRGSVTALRREIPEAVLLEAVRAQRGADRDRRARERDAQAGERDRAAELRESRGDLTGAAPDRASARRDRQQAEIDRLRAAEDRDA